MGSLEHTEESLSVLRGCMDKVPNGNVSLDFSIWDLIHTSSEHREAFLRVFQAAHVSPTIELATLESMVGMITVP